MKIVVISGSSSGLGKELAKQLNKLGYFIVGIGRDELKLKETSKDLDDNYKYFAGDISDEAFVNSTIDEIYEMGPVHSIINNASIGVFKAPKDINLEDIELSEKGTKGMMLLSAAALRKSEDIRIINILSTASNKGKAMESAYCMSKFAQKGYTESLKAYYENGPAQVSGVYLGGMNTHLYDNSRDYISEEKQKSFMDPADIGRRIVEQYFVKGEFCDIEIKRH
ncbi:MAG: SDR family oxidoreductase [Clostridia bacterium]|nr:SDR family oxidoreductase [Clostridia bacterium]